MKVDKYVAVTRRRLLGSAVTGAVGTLGVGSASARPDEWIVGIDSQAAASAATAAAAEVRHKLDFGEFGKAVAGRFPETAVERLRQRSDVSYVERDGTAHALAQDLPWGVDRIDAEIAHGSGDTGAGVDVAVLDTGIDSDHPDLQANLGAGKAFVSCSGSNCNYAWDDDNDHGTHVAGTIGAVDNSQGVVGVAPGVTLHAVKVLNDWGGGSYSDIAAGIEYVADQGWDVANMSLGGSSGSTTLKNAVSYAYNNGVLLTGAAGGYPAEYSEVIAVSKTDCQDVPENLPSGTAVDVVAPGQNILSTVPGGYATRSGGSMATGMASGAAALLMARGFSNVGAEGQLCSTAESLPYPSSRIGCGLVDAAASLGYPSSDDGSC